MFIRRGLGRMFRTSATLAQPHPWRSWMTGRAPVVFAAALAVVMPCSALLSRVDARLGAVVPAVESAAPGRGLSEGSRGAGEP